MRRPRIGRLCLGVGLATAALVVVPAGSASAHPLGNFTINHYHGLALHADHIVDSAVLDTAEIPTAQQRPGIDRDHNGSIDNTERAAAAAQRCAALASSIELRVGSTAATFRPTASSFSYRPGAAGLLTSRLDCQLRADVDLARAQTVVLTDRYLADRLGWREITAVGTGVHLDRSPVPAQSISDELQRYPNDLLSSPLDVRSASIRVLPGAGVSTLANDIAKVPGAGPLARGLDRINRAFTDLVGARHAGLGVGLLAVGLSLLLGASHAALPGHGKTVMAAYIAGRRGSLRDVITVGTTVTVTHTAGVLLLGLALTLSASLAGDRITRDLGIVSGLLVAIVGGGLLWSALKERRHRVAASARSLDAVHHATAPAPVLVGAGGLVHGAPAQHNDHAPQHEQGHAHVHAHGHHHGHSQGHHHHGDRPLSRRGLIGMGVAGGLVPSPSALVVLLGAIALGRTAFGVMLVIGYGLGMAITLSLAGLLLVKLRRRLDRPAVRDRLQFANRLSAVMPIITAMIVIAVGLVLAGRGASLGA